MDRVVYICDGNACGDKCGQTDCHMTSDVTHAKNFQRNDNGEFVYYSEVNNSPDRKLDEVTAFALDLLENCCGLFSHCEFCGQDPESETFKACPYSQYSALMIAKKILTALSSIVTTEENGDG